MCKHYEDPSESCTRKMSKEDVGRIRQLLAVAELDARSEPFTRPAAPDDAFDRVPTVKLPPAIWLSSYKAEQPESVRVPSLAGLQGDALPVFEITHTPAPPPAKAKTHAALPHLILPTAAEIDEVFPIAASAVTQTPAQVESRETVVPAARVAVLRAPQRIQKALVSAAIAVGVLGGLLAHVW